MRASRGRRRAMGGKDPARFHPNRDRAVNRSRTRTNSGPIWGRPIWLDLRVVLLALPASKTGGRIRPSLSRTATRPTTTAQSTPRPRSDPGCPHPPRLAAPRTRFTSLARPRSTPSFCPQASTPNTRPTHPATAPRLAGSRRTTRRCRSRCRTCTPTPRIRGSQCRWASPWDRRTGTRTCKMMR